MTGKEPDELTIPGAAEMAGRSISSIRSWLKKGKIKGRKAGRAKNAPVLIGRTELLRVMDEMKTRAPVPVKPLDRKQDSAQAWANIIQQKDRLIDQLHHEISRLQEAVRQQEERIAALHREVLSLGGEGRGILGFLSKRLGF